MKIKEGSFVKGLWSPFVHGQVKKIDGAFVILTNGGVFPLESLVKVSKKQEQEMPDFKKSLKNSCHGLNILGRSYE